MIKKRDVELMQYAFKMETLSQLSDTAISIRMKQFQKFLPFSGDSKFKTVICNDSDVKLPSVSVALNETIFSNIYR